MNPTKSISTKPISTKSILASALTAALSLFALATTAQTPSADFSQTLAAHGIRFHETVNTAEFDAQYAKNREQWDAAFAWLQNHDLATIAKGKHPIEGTKMVVSVEDSQNANLESRTSESHYHHVDLQLVVRGAEGFYLLDHGSATPNTKWKEDVIRYDFDAQKSRFVIGYAGDMMLFFPQDWHVAKVQTPFADQTLRVVVIKLDYKE